MYLKFSVLYLACGRCSVSAHSLLTDYTTDARRQMRRRVGMRVLTTLP